MTPRDRAVLALGALVVGVVLSYGRTTNAVDAWSRRQQADAIQVTRALAERRADAGGEQVTRLVTLAKKAAEVREEWFLTRGGEALADAALAQLVKEAADGAEAELASIQPTRAGVTSHGVRRVRARVSLSGPFAAVVNFLAALEAGPPKIVIRDLLLSQPDANVAGPRAETVRAEILLEAIALADSAGDS